MCITTSGLERKYYLHRRILAKRCPYFEALFNFKLPTVELTEDTVELEGYGCTEDAFDALVEYIYRGSYAKSLKGNRDAKCTTHANVYVLGERLCMDGLKQEALVNMAREFSATHNNMAWTKSEPIPAETIIDLIDIIYSGTPDRAITPSVDPDEATTTETAESGDANKELKANNPAITGSQQTHDNNNHQKAPKDTQPTTQQQQQPPRDKMRDLLAYNASFAIGALKKTPDFVALLQASSEFLEDLLVYLPERVDRQWDFNALY